VFAACVVLRQERVKGKIPQLGNAAITLRQIFRLIRKDEELFNEKSKYFVHTLDTFLLIVRE
jgi:hypothetical protein